MWRAARAAINPAGGVRYHLRAWRRSVGPWSPFRVALAEWLSDWQPRARTLAIVGPSAGYCLPLAPLTRFERLIIFEPDPIARWLLGKRLRDALGATPITWIATDAWIEPLRHGGGVPEALLRHDTALLFSNFVGQLPFLVPPEEWASWRTAWCKSLWPVLARIPWASFHDRVSGTAVPELPLQFAQRRWSDAEVSALFETGASGESGRVVELLDHCSLELLPEGRSYRYFDWPLTAETHHLIECVIGRP